MSLIAGKKDDTTRDRVFEDFPEFWSAFELSVEIIDRNMRNSELTTDSSPRLLRKDMEEDSLHENERREFLRDKSRPFAHTTDTVVVSRFDKMEADKPHEKNRVMILIITKVSGTQLLFLQKSKSLVIELIETVKYHIRDREFRITMILFFRHSHTLESS